MIRIHSIEPFSRSNGPGPRAVVWMQGCTLGCPGCYNPATHDPSGGVEMSLAALLEPLISPTTPIEGVSISGGEPFQQPEALAKLCRGVRERELSVLVFSGYTIEEIRRMPLGPEILRHVDILIAGRYRESRRLARGLLGSANQNVHFLSKRYSPADLAGIPAREVIVHRDGSITLTGIGQHR